MKGTVIDDSQYGFSDTQNDFSGYSEQQDRKLFDGEVAQLRTALDSEVLYVALSRSITASAIDKFEERHRNNRTLYITLAAAIASFVLAVGGFAVDAFIGLRVDQKVATAKSELETKYEFPSKVAALNTEIFLMDQNDGLNSRDLDRLIQSARRLYIQAASSKAVENGLTLEEIDDNRRFITFSIETLIENSVAAGLGERARQIEEFAPEVAETSNSILQSLVQSYGRDLLADPAAPGSWLREDGDLRQIYKRYKALALRAKDNGYPELYLFFELLLRHVEQRPEEEMQTLLDRIEVLNQTDRNFFMQLMTRLANGEYKREPDNESRHVAGIVRDFLEKYKDDDETFTLVTANAQLKPLK